jgi:hypothetical protein
VDVRSIFSAIATPENTFKSLADILTNIRNGIYIDTSVVPKAAEGSVCPAYVYDFYITPDFDQLFEKYNKSITRADLEKNVTEFAKHLKKIANSLSLRGPLVHVFSNYFN